MKTIFLLLAFILSANLSVRADDYQYVWNKTTAAEETVTDWASLPSNGTHYARIAMSLQYMGQHFLQFVQSDYTKEACTNEHAIAEIRDCDLRISYQNKVFRCDIDSGYYNWLDPFGMTWKTMPYVEWLRNAKIKLEAETQHFAVHGGETRWPSVYMRGWCKNADYFTFDGGSHTIGGTVLMPYDADSDNNLMPKMHFVVTNGAKVAINGFKMGSGTASYVTGNDFYFTVGSGAEVTISGKFQQAAPGGAVGSGVHRQHLLVDDATLRGGSSAEFLFGGQDYIKAANFENDILFTNAVFESKNKVYHYNGTVRFVDSALTNKYMRMGLTGPAARLELKNTDFYMPSIVDGNECQVGYGGTGVISIDGGKFYAKQLDVGGDWSATAYHASTGTLELAANTTASVDNLYLGKRYGGRAWVELPPTRTLNCNGGLTLGRSGVGELTVSGGTCTAASVSMGSSTVSSLTTAPGTNLLKITSGTMTVSSLSSGGGVLAGSQSAANARPCRVELLGGELTTPRLVGNTATRWSELVADGGTVKSNRSRTDWLGSFHLAALGSKGLTLDSAGYNVTIAQNFTNQVSETGRLILTGTGTKTLTGTDSHESELVVAGGSVVLAAGAAHHSDVIVTNGASVKFSTSAAAVLGNLTLGDADTNGVMTLVNGTTNVLSGNLVVSRSRFSFEGFNALDTTSTVFTVAGTVSDASFEKLNESVFVSGLPTGATAEFVLERGAPNVIKVIVREPIEYDVTVTEGDVTNSVDRTYMTADTLAGDVSADAYLTLAGANARGGLLKRGAGTMYVTNEANRFLGSVILYEGRLSVSSILALGCDAAGTGLFHLSGGTLELADPADPAVFPYTLVTDPATATAPVVVKTDEPTVVKSLTCTSGALFKRGKAPLVFRADADVTWNGGSCNWTKSYSQLTAPETGWPFDDAKGTLPGSDCEYDEFNVVEGDVIFTSPGEERVNYTFCKNFRVGVPTQVRSEGAPDPRLVVDHAAVTCGNNSSRNLQTVGGFMNDDNCSFESAGLVLTNSALLHAYYFIANRSGKGSAYATFPTTIDIDHSTFEAENALCPAGATINLRQSAAYVGKIDSAGNGSIGAICVSGNSTFNLDASVIAKNAAGDPISFNGDYGQHAVNCRNGSRFCCNFFGWWGHTEYRRRSYFNFDDGEWFPGATDFTFDGATFGYDETKDSQGTWITATGKGLILAPPENCTYTFAKKLYGTGGLVKRGAGTLNISATNLLATGTIALEAGTLTLPDASVTNALALAGGTLKDTALAGVTILSSYQAGATTAVPTFDGVTFSGTTKIDFSGADLGKEPFVFAHVSGTAPDVSGWRVSKPDRNRSRASFAVVGSDIVATPKPKGGVILLIR